MAILISALASVHLNTLPLLVHKNCICSSASSSRYGLTSSEAIISPVSYPANTTQSSALHVFTTCYKKYL